MYIEESDFGLFFPWRPKRLRRPREAVSASDDQTLRVWDLDIPLSSCGVPATASAYSLNVTAGAVVANAAIVPAGTNGAISIFVANRTHVILDIDGYFAP